MRNTYGRIILATDFALFVSKLISWLSGGSTWPVYQNCFLKLKKHNETILGCCLKKTESLLDAIYIFFQIFWKVQDQPWYYLKWAGNQILNLQTVCEFLMILTLFQPSLELKTRCCWPIYIQCFAIYSLCALMVTYSLFYPKSKNVFFDYCLSSFIIKSYSLLYELYLVPQIAISSQRERYLSMPTQWWVFSYPSRIRHCLVFSLKPTLSAKQADLHRPSYYQHWARRGFRSLEPKDTYKEKHIT